MTYLLAWQYGSGRFARPLPSAKAAKILMARDFPGCAWTLYVMEQRHMKICASGNLELINGALAHVAWEGAVLT